MNREIHIVEFRAPKKGERGFIETKHEETIIYEFTGDYNESDDFDKFPVIVATVEKQDYTEVIKTLEEQHEKWLSGKEHMNDEFVDGKIAQFQSAISLLKSPTI